MLSKGDWQGLLSARTLISIQGTSLQHGLKAGCEHQRAGFCLPPGAPAVMPSLETDAARLGHSRQNGFVHCTGSFCLCSPGSRKAQRVLTTACCQPDVSPARGPSVCPGTARCRRPWVPSMGCFQLVALALWTGLLIRTDETTSREVPSD